MSDFLTAEVQDPTLLDAGRRLAGAQPFIALEAAWCFEFHAHLTALAGHEGIDLILMGGHAASLRVAAHQAQRGSRDIDYIVAADPERIEALVHAAALRIRAAAVDAGLVDADDGLLVALPHSPKVAVQLPMRTWIVQVPPLVNAEHTGGIRQVKLEFHLADPASIPQAETITGVPYALSSARDARVPTLPWQIALKVLALRSPPIGIPDVRAAQIPRQLYDLDQLLRVMATKRPTGLAEAVVAQDRIESELHGLSHDRSGLWADLDSRLDGLATAANRGTMATHIRTFQQSQLPRPAHRQAAEWVASIRRIQVAMRLAAEGETADAWAEIVGVSDRLPGQRKEPGFADCRELHGTPLGRAASVQANFWAALAGRSSSDRRRMVDATARILR